MSEADERSAEEVKKWYLQVFFPDRVDRAPLLIQILYMREERLREAVALLKQTYLTEVGSDVTFTELDALEGRREAGRIVLVSHPSIEWFLERGKIGPLEFCPN